MRKQERASPNRVGVPGPIAEDRSNAEVTVWQTVPIVVAWRLAGGFLTLTASASGLGASYTDRWSISPPLAFTSTTTVDTSGPRPAGYVSCAVVAASALAPDTTYTFSYAIVIRGPRGVRAGGGSVALSAQRRGERRHLFEVLLSANSDRLSAATWRTSKGRRS